MAYMGGSMLTKISSNDSIQYNIIQYYMNISSHDLKTTRLTSYVNFN